MAINKNSHPGDRGPGCMEYSIHAALLRSEIGFWRDMIETSRHTESLESLERMRSALSLAETRLSQLDGSEEKDAAAAASGKPSNVYQLSEARRLSRKKR